MKFLKISIPFLVLAPFIAFHINASGKKQTVLVEKEKVQTQISTIASPPYPYAGIDDLGRELPLSNETGTPKANRQVGIFYFLWQGDKASKTSEHQWDLSEIIPNHPEVLKDIKHPNWGSTSFGRYYFWGEPVYGYYSGEDYWVHLRNMQLLTDADIDFLIIDATNTLIYPEQSAALMQAIIDLQEQGKNPPKLVYYTNTQSGKTMQNIYNTFYKEGAPHYHPSCWYYMEGKPLILGITKEAKGTDFETFFSYRESQWPNESIKENGWPWIEFIRPQHVYTNHKGEREIVNVSVAQHPDAAAGMGGSAFYGNKKNWGRSYRNGSLGNPETDIVYGYNAQEQWDFALKQDVPFIFITGWNEWIAGRWKDPYNDPTVSYFCDQADPEYSRDIEPTYTAGLLDNYYMQMVANIRKYKGTADIPKAANEKTIKTISQWNDVPFSYSDYTGDTKWRNHLGAQSNPEYVYVNESGRNDFSTLKVANDRKFLYFYAETVSEISNEIESNWMRLYINSDGNNKNGWNGYDYRTDRGKFLQKFDGTKWIIAGSISMKKEGNKLYYTIPAKLLDADTNKLNIEFKWSDNMQNENDPMDWYVNGDVAPGGRFNFVYRK